MGRGLRQCFKEAGAVAAVGLALAWVMNSLSPVGLSLTRDYFPEGLAETAEASELKSEEGEGSSEAADRLEAKGLQTISHERLVALFRGESDSGDVVFLDARKPERYREGHIPGAYNFDHYRAEAYLEEIVPLCLMADQVIIYCQGGECEDSEFAAVALRDLGVAPEKLYVYLEGIARWRAEGLPIQTGERQTEDKGA